MAAPSGEQYLLSAADSRAVVTEVGATLRLLELGGEAAVLSFEEGSMCSDGRGQVLAPWPNRLDEGSYRFGDKEGAAAWNEPARRNAIHGLVRWTAFSPVLHEPARLVLASTVFPQPAYPWKVSLELRYTLSADALSVEVVACNRSEDDAPFGLGFHPYLLAPGGADGAAISLDARTHLVADERGLPRASEPLADFAHAARLSGQVLGDAALDDCFGDLARGEDGRFRVTFAPRADRPRRLALAAGAPFQYCMIYTADNLAGAERRGAVAVEPMTCPPNAFASGDAVTKLAPEVPFTAAFSIELEP